MGNNIFISIENILILLIFKFNLNIIINVLFHQTGGFIPETDYLTVEPEVFTTDLVTVVYDVTIYIY